MRTHAPILPDFAADGASTPEERKTAEDAALREQAWAGLEARLAKQGCAPGHERADYEARLSHELDVITAMNFSGYFLIVADFIQWAKQQSIPVGPGARLRRGFCGGLGADDHRSGPAAPRAAVRAVPES